MSELRRLMREFLWEEDAVGVVEINNKGNSETSIFSCK